MLLVARFVPLSLVLFCVGCQKIPILQDGGEEARIVNGSKAEQGQFPFAVSLQIYIKEDFRQHFCTLSLITTRTCLGAAHCAFSKNPKEPIPASDFCGIVGSVIQRSNAICHGYSDIIVHEDYQEDQSRYDDYFDKLMNDIALFIFEEEMALNKNFVDTVPLIGPGKVDDGIIVTSLGWGTLHKLKEKFIPKTLRYVELELLPRRKCRIREIQLCISTRGKGLCAGDSGGPLIITHSGEHVQVGIASYVRFECANFKSVATAVEAYTGWIKNHTVGEPAFVSV